MAWKSWDVYVVKDGETVHRGVTGGVSRQSARELASTLFNIAKDKLMLVPKGSAGRKKRAATPMGPSRSKTATVLVDDGKHTHATKGENPVTHPYRVGDEMFSSYFGAVTAAKKIGARVVEVREDGTVIERWAPAPPAKKKERHVLRNPDGTLTEFGKIRR